MQFRLALDSFCKAVSVAMSIEHGHRVGEDPVKTEP